MAIAGDVAGADRFHTTLSAAGRALGDLAETDRAVGALVVGDVRPPTRSGALGKTVRAVTDAAGVTLTAGSAQVVYAGVIHNGWPAHHIRPQPFLTQAIDRQVDAITDRYVDHIDEAISTVKGT